MLLVEEYVNLVLSLFHRQVLDTTRSVAVVVVLDLRLCRSLDRHVDTSLACLRRVDVELSGLATFATWMMA